MGSPKHLAALRSLMYQSTSLNQSLITAFLFSSIFLLSDLDSLSKSGDLMKSMMVWILINGLYLARSLR